MESLANQAASKLPLRTLFEEGLLSSDHPLNRFVEANRDKILTLDRFYQEGLLEETLDLPVLELAFARLQPEVIWAYFDSLYPVRRAPSGRRDQQGGIQQRNRLHQLIVSRGVRQVEPKPVFNSRLDEIKSRLTARGYSGVDPSEALVKTYEAIQAQLVLILANPGRVLYLNHAQASYAWIGFFWTRFGQRYRMVEINTGSVLLLKFDRLDDLFERALRLVLGSNRLGSYVGDFVPTQQGLIPPLHRPILVKINEAGITAARDKIVATLANGSSLIQVTDDLDLAPRFLVEGAIFLILEDQLLLLTDEIVAYSLEDGYLLLGTLTYNPARVKYAPVVWESSN